MCGRYVTPSQAAAEREMEIGRRNPANPFKERFNVAPTTNVPVVRIAEGSRECVDMRWGLVPFFAKGIPGKYSTINAKVETIETAASYRGPWKRGQRCLMLASGFYEWQVQPDGTKRPFYIHLTDQPVFAFAALWDRSVTDDGVALESCTIITMPASPFMAEIHNDKKREPAMLERKDHQAWLSGSADEARAVLRPYPDDLLAAWPVSKAVNSPKNQGQELIRPSNEATI